MRRQLRSLAVALAAGLVLSPATARAQFITFSDLAAWTAAVGVAALDTFNDLPGGTFTAPAARLTGAHAYQVSTAISGQQFFNVGPVGDRWLSTNVATDTLVFRSFGPLVRGVGGSFFGTDSPGNFMSGRTVRISATNAGGTSSFTITPTSATGFFGIVSTAGALTSFRVAMDAAGPTSWATANDFRVAIVPEPRSWLLLGTGMVLLLAIGRRRGVA
jgi:hypothetical protein